MEFAGPRPAALKLDSLADDIWEAMFPVIDAASLSADEKAETKKKLGDAISEVFLDRDGAVPKLRQHIHDLWRERKETS